MDPIPILCGGCNAEIQIDPAMLDTPMACAHCQWPIEVKLYGPLVEAKREMERERKARQRAANEQWKEEKRIAEDTRAIEAAKRRETERERMRQVEAIEIARKAEEKKAERERPGK